MLQSGIDPILTVLEFGTVQRPIGNYGVMLAVAMLVGSFLAVRSASRANLDVGATLASLGFTLGGGLLGGFIAFWFVEWIRTGSPLTAITQPGLVFYGSPIGGGIALYFSTRGFGIPLGRLLDVSMHAFPVGHALGRVGCFFGGCCYGRPWEGVWSVRYTHPIAPGAYPSVWRHPTPLYESFALLLLAGVLFFWRPRVVGRGNQAGRYLVGYALIRVMLELYRGDSVRGLYWGGMISTSQFVSIGFFVLGVAFLLISSRRSFGDCCV